MAEKWGRWLLVEIEILKNHYPISPRETLLRLLSGRTWRAIGHIANEKLGLTRGHNIPKSREQKDALHEKMSISRGKRIEQPFAGKRHTADTKLRISISNLYARFNCVADIAALHGITEKEVREIIEKRNKKGK